MPPSWGLALPLLLPWLAGGVGSAGSTSGMVKLLSRNWPGIELKQLQTPSYGQHTRREGKPPIARDSGVACTCPAARNLSLRSSTGLLPWLEKEQQGVCEAACERGCKFGECVGPNKCRCFPGYTGNTCSQDVNECGLQPRPCAHRCVNTYGGYRCFCLSGHVLLPDATCADSRTCAMRNCQYGCEDTEAGPRCLCPSPGLHVAPDGRVCTDIDECASGKAVCPSRRRCVNTFGSYYCKCQVGFELQYIRGRYDCVDINECAEKTHTCNCHADCLNTQGSFKCKCKQGYKGNGLQCSSIPENSVKEVFRARGTVKDTIKKLLAHKNSMKKKEQIKNAIPEASETPAPKVLRYEESVFRSGNSSGDQKGNEERKEEGFEDERREEKAQENHSGQEQTLRGDVFSPQVNEASEFGLVLGQRKAPTSKLEHKDHF